MAVPTKPTSSFNYQYAIPNDLLSPESGRNFCTQIQMVQYQSSYATGYNQYTVPQGGVVLPMPKKINDYTLANWAPVNVTAMGSSLLPSMLTGIGELVGGVYGTIVNPFLWLFFRGMNFKEIQLSWTLTANNEQESRTIRDIITYLKANMLPLANENSALMDYPWIALVKFLPDDVFGQFRLKPCAVVGVNADYAGAGGPSFFRNGAPTVVNLTIQLKEIEIWTRNNYFVGAPPQTF